MTAMERLLRLLLGRLVTNGELKVIVPAGETFTVGDGAAPHAAIRFEDSSAVADLLRDPELKLGELYMDGRLTVVEGDLPALIDLLLQRGLEGRRDAARKPLDLWRALRHALLGANGLARARRNVERHYDLGAPLYDLFLDAERHYSCAYFETPEANLEEAQRAKCRRLAAKLLMRHGVSVLDIGSGWGGLACYLAEIAEAGAVHGITLSREQARSARARARARRLDNVAFSLRDYRELEGTYDRIVSVGMFEHVGPQHYETFFRKCAGLLAPDGVMLLHTIGHSSTPGPTNAWIVKHVFPGGYLPSLSEVTAAVEKAGLRIADVEVLRQHYADTLREWRRRFLARRDAARALYDERFCRMWEFYLTICEASFRRLDSVVFQVQLTRRADVVPITRAYLAQAEARLKRAEAAHARLPLPAPAAQPAAARDRSG